MLGGSSAAFIAACGGSSTVTSVVPDGSEAAEPVSAFFGGTAVSFPQSVWTGDPSDTSVVVSTRAFPRRNAPLRVSVDLELAMDETFETILRTETLQGFREAGFNYRDRPGDYIVRTVLNDLEPGQLYYYRFKSSDDFFSPVGRFRTLPAENDGGQPIKFIHMSCANEPPYPVAGAIGIEIPNLDPDFVVFNGDTVYADAFWLGLQPEPNLEFYRGLYRQQRDPSYTGFGFTDLFPYAPFISNWDDHEVNNDYAGRGGRLDIQPDFTNVNQLKRLGYQSFLEYTPVRPTFSDNPGVPSLTRVFRTTRAGANLELFTLDLRQYRDLPGGIIATAPLIPALPPGFTPEEVALRIEETLEGRLRVGEILQLGLFGGPEAAAALRRPRTIMGAQQKGWFLNALRSSTAVFKVIVSELIFSENYALPWDRWEGFALEREEVISFIEQNNIRNVIVISGDQHAGQISLVNPTPDNQIPSNPIWEVGTGPTGQSTLARSVDEIGALLGIPDGSLVYYDLVNFFAAPVELGGKPGSTRNSLRFYEINEPNFTTVQVDGGRFLAQIKDRFGSVVTDPLGRRGEIEIFAS